jgi:hypothetical protein
VDLHRLDWVKMASNVLNAGCTNCGRARLGLEPLREAGAYCGECWPNLQQPPAPSVRTFATGATRNSLGDKLQYEGYFSPLVLRARAEYMRTHQRQEDGSLRAADNWQKGIPKDALIDSGHRHFVDWWLAHRGHATQADVREAICALMFNAEAYLHALLLEDAAMEPRA